MAGADRLGDRLVPVLGVGEDGIDVEHHATEIEQPVPHHLADRKAGMDHGRRGHGHVRPALARRPAACRAFVHHARQSRALAAGGKRKDAWQAPQPPLEARPTTLATLRASRQRISRRGARVVDRDGLENRCGCKLTVGSNPTLSANASSGRYGVRLPNQHTPRLSGANALSAGVHRRRRGL